MECAEAWIECALLPCPPAFAWEEAQPLLKNRKKTTKTEQSEQGENFKAFLSYLIFFHQFAVILHAFVAGFTLFVPFRVIL